LKRKMMRMRKMKMMKKKKKRMGYEQVHSQIEALDALTFQ